MATQEELKGIGEILDRLMSVPVYTGSSLTPKPVLLELYEAAREKFGDPLLYVAGETLRKAAESGGTVVITTGFIVPPWLRAELDGPVGAASLARALNLAYDVTPVIVTERALVEATARVCKAAGLEIAVDQKTKRYYRRTWVEEFTSDSKKARDEAESMLDRLNPTVVIAIEKGSANEVGEYHSGVGYNLTPIAAKVDQLIAAARERGIPTIGIGDGGNEIGMGCIKETVKRVVPTGAKCGCPCGAGTHAATETDSLIVCAVSNWGATALEAYLAYCLRRMEVLHDRALEDKLLEEGASAGLIDPAAGFGMSAGDAIDKEIHLAIVDMLNFIVRSRITDSLYIEKYKMYVGQKREQIQEMIRTWAY